jgi:alpha-tubulin suppressor-like RCC1 family protein
VACGDNHSCAITSQNELIVWGSNKDGQLGLDIENYPVMTKATKLVMYEYMNSAKREKFLTVKARANYTTVTCDSKIVN